MASRESLILALHETVKKSEKSKEIERFNVSTGTLISKGNKQDKRKTE